MRPRSSRNGASSKSYGDEFAPGDTDVLVIAYDLAEQRAVHRVLQPFLYVHVIRPPIRIPIFLADHLRAV